MGKAIEFLCEDKLGYATLEGRTKMMKLTISAAALIAVAAFVTVPASAENLGGGPIKQNGKCWKGYGAHDASFGAWVECPNFALDCDKGQLAFEKLHKGHEFFDSCGRGKAAAASAPGKPAPAAQRATR